MVSLYGNSFSPWAQVKPSLHYLAQMKPFCLGPLRAQLVSKVTISHMELNPFTSLAAKPRNSKPMDCPRCGSQLPGGQRALWSQIFRWAIKGALTRNRACCFTGNQALPNLTRCNGCRVGASWTEHAGGPWVASH